MNYKGHERVKSKYIFLTIWLLFLSSGAFSEVYKYTKIFSDKNLFFLDVPNKEIIISDVTMSAKYESGRGWCEVYSDYFSFFVPKSISKNSWNFSGFKFNVTGRGILRLLGSDIPYMKIESKQGENDIYFYFNQEFGLLGISLEGDMNTLALCSSRNCKW